MNKTTPSGGRALKQRTTRMEFIKRVPDELREKGEQFKRWLEKYLLERFGYDVVMAVAKQEENTKWLDVSGQGMVLDQPMEFTGSFGPVRIDDLLDWKIREKIKNIVGREEGYADLIARGIIKRRTVGKYSPDDIKTILDKFITYIPDPTQLTGIVFVIFGLAGILASRFKSRPYDVLVYMNLAWTIEECILHGKNRDHLAFQPFSESKKVYCWQMKSIPSGRTHQNRDMRIAMTRWLLWSIAHDRSTSIRNALTGIVYADFGQYGLSSLVKHQDEDQKMEHPLIEAGYMLDRETALVHSRDWSFSYDSIPIYPWERNKQSPLFFKDKNMRIAATRWFVGRFVPYQGSTPTPDAIKGVIEGEHSHRFKAEFASLLDYIQKEYGVRSHLIALQEAGMDVSECMSSDVAVRYMRAQTREALRRNF